MTFLTASAQVPLSYGFEHLQDSARTKVWWFHGETIGTHEGITADLEAFRQQGVGGVVFYDQVHGKGEGAFKVFSHDWWDELIFSSQEARRLGLNFECNASNGYVAGGSWITPDKSMQRLACTERVIEGGKDIHFQLPMEKTPGGWYQDVAIVAVPYQENLLAEVSMDEPSISFGTPFVARSITYSASAQGKARTSSMQVPPTHFSLNPDLPTVDSTRFFGCGFRELPPIGELQASDDGQTYRKVCDLRPRYRNFGGVKSQTVAFPTVSARYFRIVSCDSTVKISDIRLSARACVDAWQEKASLISEFIDGNNTPGYGADEIADFSHAINLTDRTDGQGFVHWKNAPEGKWLVLRFFSMSNGGRSKHGRAEALGLECDKLSVKGARLQWESYVKPIIDSIRIHNGLLTGICMDSHEAGPQNWTIGFEQEFERLRGYDMMPFLPVMAGFVVESVEASDKFLYDLRHTINDLIAENYYGEFNRLCRNEGLALTAQAIGGALCMAGDAISVKRLIDKPQGEFWGYQTEGNYDIKDCSSAAHLYGKQIASGEAFTDVTYKHTLAQIKNLADNAYCSGINELVVCAVAYQPWVGKDDGQIKINTANGRQYVLGRMNPFWTMSKPFWDYQARCSWLLRQGKPVCDICLYLGDNIPMRTLSHKIPHIPSGYDFDSFTTDALLNRMSVKDGLIVLPDGVSYRMMILPSGEDLTEEVRKLIASFERQGAVIYHPDTDPRTLAEAMHDAGLQPDVEAPKVPNLNFCHRRTAQEDIYFLNNHSDQSVSDSFRFRVDAVSVELWKPATGERKPIRINRDKGGASVRLSLAPRESVFVVFSRSESEQNVTERDRQQVSEQTIGGNWSVQFDPALGGPDQPVVLDTLSDWSKNEDIRIRYYAGTAICRNTFRMDAVKRQASYYLSLPLLNTVAEVVVNGKSAGVVWCSPYSLDITRFVRKGINLLELRISNTLWNRLVGDANLQEEQRIYWQTYLIAKPNDELVPSGVAGNISIICVR
ncbi:MAG: glycosyl hydrolase family 2 [Bacteroidales bacterium]|nr:glycosyl hydrolase family 2 [Bacteroidales bacterium]